MSVLARHWLEWDADARVVVLDEAPSDAATIRHFAPVADRLSIMTADLTRPGLESGLAGQGISRIAHGATVTPLSAGTAASAPHNPEVEQAARVIEVNLMGTVNLLERARRQPGLTRFINVSSGAVYRNHGPDGADEPLPEDGHVMPQGLYGISKFSAELVVNRYAELFGLSAASVRLPSVFGPMDRVTATRNHPHVPNKVAHLALASRPIRVNTLDGVGDYLHSGDAAEAIALLLRAPRLRHRVYNVGSGVATTTRELVAYAAELIPDTRAEVVPPEQADIVQDPALRSGKWELTRSHASSMRSAGGRALFEMRCMTTSSGSSRRNDGTADGGAGAWVNEGRNPATGSCRPTPLRG
jgi:UDP-glucose 4-epimerase